MRFAREARLISRTGPRAVRLIMRAVVFVVLAGCYHYAFEHRPAPPGAELVTFEERRPTYLNGFVGTGAIDTDRYCKEPVRTELRVKATDVLISIATLLVYTPHTLYVTCPAAEVIGRTTSDRTVRP